MNDVVGIRAFDSERQWVGFMTYGRLWDPIDDSEMIAAIKTALPTFGLRAVTEVLLCETLQELRGCPYFYEGLLSFASRPIAFGENYDTWRAWAREELAAGRGLFCVGSIANGE
jgi:hypothetical protein